MKFIIGIVGPIAAGKDFSAEYISRRFGIISNQISQPLKDLAKERGLPATRENLINIGCEAAKEFGEHFLAEKLLNQTETIGIITGMRQVAQVAYLRQRSDLFLLSIDAPVAVRFERALRRGKIGEASTMEEFHAREVAENSSPNVQRLFECMRMADATVSNESLPEILYEQINSLLDKRISSLGYANYPDDVLVSNCSHFTSLK